MSRNLQAIVFDFDGVIANSEPLHFTAFKQALDEDGIELTAADYYGHYLGYDDVGAFQAIGRDRGLPMSAARVAELVTRKGDRLQTLLANGSVLFPGAVEFIRQAADVVPIAIPAPRNRRDSGGSGHRAALQDHRGVGRHAREQAVAGAVSARFRATARRNARTPGSAANRRHRRFAVGTRIGTRCRVTLCWGDEQLSGAGARRGGGTHRREPRYAHAGRTRPVGGAVAGRW